MNIGIIGLSQVGKKTLFNLLTKVQTEKTKGSFGQMFMGVGEVKDERLYVLAKAYNPKKITPVTNEYSLFPKIQSDAEKTRQFLSGLAEMNAVIHLVRGFSLESEDSVFQDIDTVNNELVFSDMFKVENRLEKLDKELKKIKDPVKEKEYQAVKKCKEFLENGKFLRDCEFTQEEEKFMRGFQFLTRKGLLLVLNIDEDSINNFELLEKIKKKYEGKNTLCLQVSCKLESEINQLPENERVDYMKELGIKKSAIDEITKYSFSLLDLIQYFTAGEPEVRGWAIKKGTNAQKAAGEIHSDIERGFIRAEVIKYNDFLLSGCKESQAREKGLYLLRGKEYIVEDGDIINFRFNV